MHTRIYTYIYIAFLKDISFHSGTYNPDCGQFVLSFSKNKLLYIEWINNKVLLYSTENYIQYPIINHNGKEYLKKECVYIYVCV